MTSRLPGACLRAAFVATMVLLPSLLLAGTDQQAGDAADAIVLVGLFAAVFTFVEYGAACPSLVEFRGAPPYNRTRFAMLFAMLAVIAAATGAEGGAPLARLALAVGVLLGHATDVPLSPVRLVLWLLPGDATPGQTQQVRAAAGLACLVGLVGLTAFAIGVRLRGWPAPSGGFNIWINLPTFGATAGTDVVRQLNRDGAVNILLGFLLPYVMPPLALVVARGHGVSMLDSPLALTWTMTLWAFLPASLFLRGLAMRRLALMISMKRRRFSDADGVADPAFLPA